MTRKLAWRRRLGIAVSTLLAAAAPPVAAQDPFELTLLFAPEASYSDLEGVELDSAYGLGAGWEFAESWSVELRGLVSENETRFTRYEQQTLELGLRRALGGGQAWRPYLQAGVREQSTEIEHEVVCVDFTTPCPPLSEERDETGAFVGGGVDWLFSRRTALRFDGRLALYESDATGDVEDDLDLTIGLVFRF